MALDYAKLQGRVAGVMKKVKQGVVTLSRTTTAAPDPETPWIPGAETVTTYELDATVERIDQRYENGVLIIETGDMVTFAVPPVVPEMTDTLVIDGVERAITSLRPAPAAGTVVAWKAFCGMAPRVRV